MEKSFQGHCGTLTSHSMGTGNRAEVPGLVPSPVGVGAGPGEGGWCWVSGVRCSPSAQLGWALGTLADKRALLIPREGRKWTSLSHTLGTMAFSLFASVPPLFLKLCTQMLPLFMECRVQSGGQSSQRRTKKEDTKESQQVG